MLIVIDCGTRRIHNARNGLFKLRGFPKKEFMLRDHLWPEVRSAKDDLYFFEIHD
jgi:hypothetical protein